MEQSNENETKVPSLYSINNIFHFGVFSLFQEGSQLRLVYIFINNISTDNPIYEGLVLPTGILCSSYTEAAYQVNQFVRSGIFQQTTLNIGIVYDSNEQKVDEINWGELLEKSMQEIDDDPITLH